MKTTSKPEPKTLSRADRLALCEGLVAKWRGIFGLSENWNITVSINETELETDEEERDRAAWINVRSTYFEAEATFNLWHKECESDLESVVTHELLHVLLDPLAVAAQDALASTPNLFEALDESTVTALEMAFKRMRFAR